MKTETLYFSSKLAVKVAKLFSKKFFLSLQTKQGVFEVLKKTLLFQELAEEFSDRAGQEEGLAFAGIFCKNSGV